MDSRDHEPQYSLFPEIQHVEQHHTPGHVDCPVCAQGTEGMPDPDKLRRLPFSAAAEVWLATRKPYLKQRSYDNLVSNVRQLNRFFGPS